jgi:surface protein
MNSYQSSVVTLRARFFFIISVVTVLFFIIGIQSVSAQTPTVGSFSTTWQTDNPGISSSTAITIPTTAGTYDYTVYWEDVNDVAVNGTITNITGDVTIDFPIAGTYRVDITGVFPRIYIDSGGDREKILTIEQWGDIAWVSMYHAFGGAINLTYEAVDAPDLSSVIDIGGMFFDASSFNANLDSWDVSNVTHMPEVFRDATSFNGTLNGWGADTSSVNMMSGMFRDATSFNQPLDAWDVSSVMDMSEMFSDATSFNQPLDTWDVSSVDTMLSMFNGATTFNSPLNGWGTTTAVVNTMQSMFDGATNFNQPLDTWDMSSVTDMSSMFGGATAFNRPLNGWGATTAVVTDMQAMFINATSFDQPLGNWDIGALTATGLNNTFTGTAWSKENYSTTIQAWDAQGNTPADITLETTAEYLASAVTARASLIANNTWTIIDGGLFVAPAPAPVSSGGSSGTRVGSRSSGGSLSVTSANDTLSEREELLARIAELQQLIVQLQSQVEETMTPGTATAPASCTFTRDLTNGSSGEDVTCLQTYLMSTGDYTYADGATGYFGQVTKAAVQSWQSKNGVFPAAGYFGSLSRNTLTQ